MTPDPTNRTEGPPSPVGGAGDPGPAAGANRRPAADRWYGRGQGRPLRPRQQALLDEVLPALALPQTGPLLLSDRFGDRPVWLEIGCGGGEHAAWQLAHTPDIALIACEPFVNGIASLLGHAVADGTTDRLAVWPAPAQPLLERIPDASIDRAFVLFPDPWPKQRHHKRRFVQARNLDRLARVLRTGAELRVATDHTDYLEWMLAALLAHPAFQWRARGPSDWTQRPGDWPATRYEQKAARDGIVSSYLRFLRV
ncbi:MAG: tRNA (guanine(46)-N(7))-methyltransferase TrmB [Alphaproteobacteria bacterium]|nr:tRNA (guanine(46)-N(7))-methyltransferase TrmB [Alphaproteobacteria bacterium]